VHGPCDTNPKEIPGSPAKAEPGPPFHISVRPETACADVMSAAIQGHQSLEPSSVGSLLQAMARGERQAAAEFVIRYGPQIRRRVRGKLRVSMRRLFDSQDILSTLGRRLDGYVHRGNFEARSEGELWSLVFTIAERSVVEKARIWQTLSENESGVARDLAQRGDVTVDAQNQESDPDGEFEQLLGCIPVETDRQIARLWSMGRTSDVIATELGLSPEQVRQRWCRTRDRLRERFKEQEA
jgi:DNA-directed RNA polymerase specialized sigma24 family protein